LDEIKLHIVVGSNLNTLLISLNIKNLFLKFKFCSNSISLIACSHECWLHPIGMSL